MYRLQIRIADSPRDKLFRSIKWWKARNNVERRIRAWDHREKVAGLLGEEQNISVGDRSRQAQILHPRHVSLSQRRWPARRTSARLRRHGHHRACETDEGLQRTPSHGLGCIRPPRRAPRHAHRRASREHHTQRTATPSAARSRCLAFPTTGTAKSTPPIPSTTSGPSGSSRCSTSAAWPTRSKRR